MSSVSSVENPPGRSAAGDASIVGATPRTASVFACVVALSNTLLGVSVVTVSGAFSRAGCGAGTVYLIVFASTAGCGLHLLARSSLTVSAAARRRKAEETDGGGKGAVPPSSFRTVALVGAPRWAFLIDFAVALKCFGVGTSYLILVGSLMQTVMSGYIEEGSDFGFLLNRQFWVTIGFLLAAPLACSRTVGALKYVATAAIGLVGLVAFMVLTFWLVPGLDACPDAHIQDIPAALEAVDTSVTSILSTPVSTDSPDDVDDGSCFTEANVMGSVRTMLQTLPLFVFCFTCHQNIFTICNEIVRPTAVRIDAVIVCSLAVAVSLYLTLSWGAYATFGDSVADDLLDMYPDTGFLTAARISVSMLVTTCYPLQAHPCRLCILSALKPPPPSALALENDPQDPGNGYNPVASRSIDEQRGATSEDGNASRSYPNRTLTNNTVDGSVDVSRGDLTRSPDVAGGGAARRGGNGTKWGTAEDGGRHGGVEDGGGLGNPGDDSPASPERKGLLSGLSLEALSDSHLPDSGSSLVDEEDGDGGPFPRKGRMVPRNGAGELRPRGVEEGVKSFWSTPDGARHIAVTAAILWSSYAIAMTVHDLGLVLEVVGATGSTTIAFILPGLLYLKVHPEPHPKRSLAAMQLIAGVLFIPLALTSIALGG